MRAYPTQTHEMLFDAHNHAFIALGGVPERGIYDNMKTAVDKVGRGKVRIVNRRFQVMVSHFMFEAEFCNPAAGWEKGQVEKNVRDARHRLWHEAPTFEDIKSAREWVLQFVHWYNHNQRHSGLKFITPNERHHGRWVDVVEQCKNIYLSAKARNLNRWSGGIRNWDLPEFVQVSNYKIGEQNIIKSSDGIDLILINSEFFFC